MAGLRAVLNNGTGAVLTRLLAEEAPDLLVLQEHKLQSSHVGEVEARAAHGARACRVPRARRG